MKSVKKLLATILSLALVFALPFTPALVEGVAAPQAIGTSSLPDFPPPAPDVTALRAALDQRPQFWIDTQGRDAEDILGEGLPKDEYFVEHSYMAALGDEGTPGRNAEDIMQAVDRMKWEGGDTVTQAEVDAATAALNAAMAAIKANRKPGVDPIDPARTQFRKVRLESENLIRSDAVDVAWSQEDAKWVPIGRKWVLADDWQTFDDIKNTGGDLFWQACDGEITFAAATKVLTDGIAAYKATWKDGTRPDTTALGSELARSWQLMVDLWFSPDGKDIPNNEFWVTEAQFAVYDAENEAAAGPVMKEAGGFKDDLTQAEVNKAAVGLKAANDKLAATRKAGLATPKPGRKLMIETVRGFYAIRMRTVDSVDGLDVPNNSYWTTPWVSEWADREITGRCVFTFEDRYDFTDADCQEIGEEMRAVFAHFTQNYLYTKGSAPAIPGEKPAEQNPANTPETLEKVNDTVAALRDPAKTLPKDTQTATTADGKPVAAIPLKLSSGSATLGKELLDTLGGSEGVALKLTVSSSLVDSVDILFPGGFGAITEPGRYGYPMTYAPTAPDEKTLLAAVKGDAKNDTIQLGGCFQLPTPVTVTVKTTIPEGSAVNVYRYDPDTKLFTLAGTGTVQGGKLQFATQLMGQLLFTTGKIG